MTTKKRIGMKTELIHSYSSTSLSGLSRSPSTVSFALNNNNGQSTSTTGLVAQDGYPSNSDEDMDGCFKQLVKKTFRKKLLYKKFPILNWLPQYTLAKLIADVIAGITVGLTILPQGLALASVANLPPQYGLYSGFVGCFVYIIFGGTVDVTIGPTAIMAIITLSYSSGKPPEYAVLLCFVTGIMTLLMGFLQLGESTSSLLFIMLFVFVHLILRIMYWIFYNRFIVNFISTPVMSGFTSAAALTICSTQVKALLGLNFPAEGFLDVVKGTVKHASEIKLNDSLVSLVCCVVLITLMKLQLICKCLKSSPGISKVIWLISTSRSVIVIVACTIIFSIMGDPTEVEVVGDLVAGIPPFKVPEFSFPGNITEGQEEEYTFTNLLKDDASALIVLPLLALMEHISIAKAYAGTGRVDATQEMIAIGLSNLIGCFFSSMPITGAFSRTVVNHSSGAASPLGGLVTGTLVLLALQFLTPYFFYIPKASLAAVIVCAVIFTVDLEIIYPMWKSKKMDLIPWAATFLVSVLIGLEIGVLVGFAISVLFLLYYAARPGVRVKKGETSTGVQFILVDLDRSLTFPSVEYTRYVVMKSGINFAKGVLPVVVDCQHIQFADFTAAQGMRDLFKMFNEKDHKLILWQVKPSIVRILTSVMEINGVPFKHCRTEDELELLLEECMKDLESKHDIKITFTNVDDDDDDDNEDNKKKELSTAENDDDGYNADK